MTLPTVSVIMASYKGAALVGETIESVLSQSFQDFELVIVDDCSPDNTLDVLRSFDDPRIRVIASPVNQGPVKTRNIAMAEARGRYLAGLDQDDICLPDRFARQVAYLEANADVALVAAAADLLEAGKVRRGKFRGPTTPEFLRWQLHLGNPLVWSSVMFRADVARRLDPVTRPEMLFAEDFDLYHRIGAFGRVARIDEPLLLYRIHPGGVSKAFEDVMLASTRKVLSEVYQPIFGAEAEDAAALIIDHVAHGGPLGDREALQRLANAIMRLKGYFFDQDACDANTRRQIDRAVSALWWRIIRTAVRAGALPPSILASPRPAGARFADMPLGDMIVSGMIGAARRVAA
jgi:glycosyltransferase involved in cell wall biosynthesis